MLKNKILSYFLTKEISPKFWFLSIDFKNQVVNPGILSNTAETFTLLMTVVAL